MEQKESLQSLIQQMQQEAQKEEFPIDQAVYTSAKRDPFAPILYAGSLKSPICFFARDLGKDEVFAGQPLYGAAGKLVRNGIHCFLYKKKAQTPDELQQAADQVLLTNTVPYKPIGNKAFSTKIKERFRPFITYFLTDFWQGHLVIPLGNEALEWFASYAQDQAAFTKFTKTEERFQKNFDIILQSSSQSKKITLAPLPHPSPLNQKYFHLFPQMLMDRLQQIQDFLPKL